MLYAVLLSALSILCATAWLVYSAGKRFERTVQAIMTEIRKAATERPKTLSALGDAVDALQVHLRELDTKAEGILSLARSNRAKIVNVRREFGLEAGADGSVEPKRSDPQIPHAPRFPGRI